MANKIIELSTGSKIEMREPKVRDMMIVDNESTAAKKELSLMANLCNLTTDEIQDMNLRDYGELQGALKGFMS
jgi:hypothetical protein